MFPSRKFYILNKFCEFSGFGFWDIPQKTDGLKGFVFYPLSPQLSPGFLIGFLPQNPTKLNFLKVHVNDKTKIYFQLKIPSILNSLKDLWQIIYVSIIFRTLFW